MSIKNINLGNNVTIHPYTNIYNCNIDDETTIGPFVEIQSDVVIGKKCKIQSHSFICEGSRIGNFVFIGHGVIFCNDKYPKATNKDQSIKTKADWLLEPVIINDYVSIGSNVTLLPGIIIGKNSIIGAGSVVTKNIPENEIWIGNPAKFYKHIDNGEYNEIALS